MGQHDSGYRLLFSHPYLVECLLRGFVPGAWTERLDFCSLEQTSASRVSDRLKSRKGDLVWRLKWRGRDGWLYVYLLLELQSTRPKFMALRALTYLSMLWEDLVRADQLTPNGRLPPVLPLVLYNGQTKWRAPTEIESLLSETPDEIAPYRPRFRMMVIDERSLPRVDPEALQDPVSCLFGLEGCESLTEATAILSRLAACLDADEHAELRRAFTGWLTHAYLPTRLPDVPMPAIGALEEVPKMLQSREVPWSERWVRKGVREGMARGRQETLIAQLEHKFGKLDARTRQCIEHANRDRLLEWSVRILDAASLDEVFDPAS